MTEIVGLAASIIQIAGTGAKLSSALYHFTNSAVHAEQDIADIANDVDLTSNALESVGKVFETEDARSIVSKKVIQDANNIIERCKVVFTDISELVDKRRKLTKDGKKSLGMVGKLSWPLKEPRVELHRRRLESLKNSLVLLLHVLQLAQGQSRGQMEKHALELEREKIRELHQRQQDSLKCLQALENKFCKTTLDDEEILQGSSASSRVPTLELMFGAASTNQQPVDETDRQEHPNVVTIDLTKVDDSALSDSDAAMSDQEDESISIQELAKAAKQVQCLLKRITLLQRSLEAGQKSKLHKRKRIHKIYQRFCDRWESDIRITCRPATEQEVSSTDSPTYLETDDEYEEAEMDVSDSSYTDDMGGRTREQDPENMPTAEIPVTFPYEDRFLERRRALDRAYQMPKRTAPSTPEDTKPIDGRTEVRGWLGPRPLARSPMGSAFSSQSQGNDLGFSEPEQPPNTNSSNVTESPSNNDSSRNQAAMISDSITSRYPERKRRDTLEVPRLEVINKPREPKLHSEPPCVPRPVFPTTISFKPNAQYMAKFPPRRQSLRDPYPTDNGVELLSSPPLPTESIVPPSQGAAPAPNPDTLLRNPSNKRKRSYASSGSDSDDLPTKIRKVNPRFWYPSQSQSQSIVNTDATEDKGSGRDIVDILLEEWTVPVY